MLAYTYKEQGKFIIRRKRKTGDFRGAGCHCPGNAGKYLFQ